METARSNRSPVVGTTLNLNDDAVHSNQPNEAELRPLVGRCSKIEVSTELKVAVC